MYWISILGKNQLSVIARFETAFFVVEAEGTTTSPQDEDQQWH